MKHKTTYTEEFQDQAVRLVIADGKSISTAARELGLQTALLCQWVQKYRHEAKVPNGTVQESDLKEQKALRKRLAELLEEREILQKAAAYFAENRSKE